MSKWRLDAGQIEVVDDCMAAILRSKTPAQRVAMVFAANRTARRIIEGSVRSLHPTWPAQQVKAEVARRMLGST